MTDPQTLDSAQSVVPAGYDAMWLLQQLKVAAFGYENQPDGSVLLRYRPASLFDTVEGKIQSYPVDRLVVELPAKLATISAERDRRIQSFSFGGQVIPLDETTKLNLDCACLGLMRNTDVTEIDWSLGDGNFVPLPRDTVLAMADAAFKQTQNLFTKHSALAAACKGAADINALAAIDVTSDAAWA